ncbi:uncharacterized protein LOC141903573 [Tubulanus polymorphus]|uniref:uncharacterized protein LOC141903573 n=1 Tax=Tubulanus polymorphus TaxID=672921 RepID=UPI003DA5C10A
MYNGIGLETARGSGTNGYVQRNMSQIRHHKDHRDFKSEDDLKKLDQVLNKKPNVEILEHERKRKVELKCVEMEELMEEQGYDADEIDEKVALFRKMLTEKEGVADGSNIDKDDFGRPVAKATHQIAEANQEKNDLLRQAFGLSSFYVDGSSFDPNRKTKEAEAAAKAAAEQKAYDIVRSSSSSSSPEPRRSKKSRDNEKKKKRKKTTSQSPPLTKRGSDRRSRSRSPKKRGEKRSKSKSPTSRRRGHSKHRSEHRRSRSESPKHKQQSRRVHRSRSESPQPKHKSRKRDHHRSRSRSESPYKKQRSNATTSSRDRRHSDNKPGGEDRSRSRSTSPPPRHKKKDKKRHKRSRDDDFPID